MKKFFNKTEFFLLVLLFAFLPFSSWLVSYTGQNSFSLLRDLLVFLIFLLFIFFGKIKLNKITVVVGAFILFGLLSYFWREASALQWLRGFRFTFVPMILFLAVSNINVSKNEKKILLWIILSGGILIALVSIAEFFGLHVPLTSSMSGNLGLENALYLQGSGIRRLQSLLAGPNALGLYMLALSAYALGAFKIINNKLIWLAVLFGIILVGTFSRSSLFGLIAILIAAGYIFIQKKFGVYKALVFSAVLIFLIIFTGLYLWKSEKYQSFITHGTSSSLRYEQVTRLWNQKYEIGLLGRGSGTSGPSSQNRLDQGPNHWSENTFLEIFEELGLLGFLFFITIYIMLLQAGYRNISKPFGKTAFLITIGFAVTGLFVNNYTGQAGIYLFWLAAGLNLKEEDG